MKCAFIMTTNSEEEPDYYDVLDGVDLDQLTEAERDVLVVLRTK